MGIQTKSQLYAILAAHGPAFAGPSSADILSHHPGILVFENVAVVHEGMVPRGGSVKGDQKVGAVLNENHVLPPRKMRWRWRIRE